jgi:hypothetical protein
MSNLFQDDGSPANGGRKICLATTAYESPDAAYTFSIQKTREAMHKVGLPTAYYLLSGNCHVDDARNSIVQEFLLSDCTELVFLDADVVWEPEELIKLCQYDADVVGGVYPFRRDDEPSKANMPVLMYPGQVTPDSRGLIEVAGLPTGFMRIKRHVLETLADDANKHWKRNDRRAKVPILFERAYLDGLRLGGDLNFCRKWIEKGGVVHAAPDIHLGHVVRSVVYDSLGAALRRQGGETLKYLADHVRSGGFDSRVFAEARRAMGNPWGALEDVLTLCAVMGKKADGPIIEAGSGLTSIVLAASTRHKVYSLEHDPHWANELEGMARKAGVSNIELRICPIRNGWYEVPNDIPSEFALGLNDGPPRTIGSRMGFLERFGNTPQIICDDADDLGYGDDLQAWCGKHGRRIDFIERSAVIR